MADDITLTVRVRDLTRGEFSQLRQRMRGMDEDMRRVGGSANNASVSARRFSENIRGVSTRLGELSRTGSTARHEMTFMNRSMSLLGREMRHALRSGQLTREEFQALQGELERTRLDYDYLTRDVERHSAIAQRAARAAAQQQRQVDRQARTDRQRQVADARAITAQLNRLSRAHTAALREEARRQAAADRADMQRRIANARQTAAQLTRISRAQTAALREDAQRQAAAARAAAAARRQAMRDEEREIRLFRQSQAEPQLTRGFRGAGIDDTHALVRGFTNLRNVLNGVGASSNAARQRINLFSRDVNAMSLMLDRARQVGHITRRDFDLLSAGLAAASRNTRDLARSGDLTRENYRSITREIRRMREELDGIDRSGNVFSRLHSRLGVLHRRLQDVDSSSGRLRHTLARLSAPLVDGFRRALPGIAMLLGGLVKMGGLLKINSRWTAILIAALLLIGPVAQALGALLVTALGGAFIALGAFALKGSASVKRAFSDMKDSVASDVKAAAQPMEGFLVNAIGQVQKAVSTMRPALQEAFTATGPLIENFFGAFTDLAGRALPGFVASLQAMKPAIEGFRTGLGLIGEGIGQMFEAMMAGGGAEALGRVWVVLGKELQNLLVGIGEFINMAARSNTATLLTVTVFRTLSGILNAVSGAFKILDAVFGDLFGMITDSGIGLTAFADNVDSTGKSFVAAGQDAASLKKQLQDVDKEIERIQKVRKEGVKGVSGSAEEYALKGMKASEEDLTAAQAKRKALLDAIAAADASAAQSAYAHAAAVNALKESIRSLNEQNLNRLDAQGAMEKAIDDAAKKTEELTGKVTIQNGVINQGNDAGRQAHEVLSAIARTTSEYVAKLQEANAPQNEINAAWARGRDQLIGMHDELGVSKAELAAYADIVLQTPQSVTTKLKVEKEQADAAIASLKKKFNEVDGKEAKTKASMDIFRAMERASQVESKLNALNGKTANTYITTTWTTKYETEYGVKPPLASAGRLASGGSVPRYATGGGLQAFPHGGYVQGPGTGTSDNILAMMESGAMARISNTEYVIRAAAVRKYGKRFLDAVNTGRLKVAGYASGGNVKGARKDLASQFGISLFGRLSGARLNPFEKGLGTPADMGSLVSTLNSLMGSIKKAFDGKTEKNLVNRLTSTGKALIAQEKKLTKVNASLDKAKTKLDDLKQSASSLRASVASGVMGETAITRGVTGDRVTTLPDIMTTMQGSRDKATAFARALADLKAKGFSGEIIRQVAEAGIGGGGLETAGALLTASASDIASFNSMQAEISAAAKAAGVTAADAMYGAGIKAAEGLVNGLTAQKKAIEKAMMDIAKSMEKAIKKALGIKSPSKVMQDVGHDTAQGFALGMTDNRDVDTAWSSMLNRGPAAGGSATAAAGGGTYTLPVYIGNKLLDEIILDSNRRTVRTRGGNVQNVYGQRNS